MSKHSSHHPQDLYTQVQNPETKHILCINYNSGQKSMGHFPFLSLCYVEIMWKLCGNYVQQFTLIEIALHRSFPRPPPEQC